MIDERDAADSAVGKIGVGTAIGERVARRGDLAW